jgi:hypothetical protein
MSSCPPDGLEAVRAAAMEGNRAVLGLPCADAYHGAADRGLTGGKAGGVPLRAMFKFIADDRLQRILERDWEDLCHCLEAGAHKSVLVMAGSIVEATLVDYFVGMPPGGRTSEGVLKMTLNELLNEAVTAGLVCTSTRNLCDAVKDFRNLIHPGREIRVQGVVDAKRAGLSRHLVEIVVEEVGLFVAKQGRVTPDKLIEMVTEDPTKGSIAEFMLRRMTSTERDRLLGLLARAVELRDASFETEVVAALVDVHALTKKMVPATFLENAVRALPELLKGDTLTFLTHLKLYADDLQFLPDEDRTAIVVFVASKLKQNKATIEQVERTCGFNLVGRYVNEGNVNVLARVLGAIPCPLSDVARYALASLGWSLSAEMEAKLTALLTAGSVHKSIIEGLDPF